MYRILSDAISVRDLAMLLANVSTTPFVPDTQETGHKDDTYTKAFKCVNCDENHTSYNKKCCVNMIFNILEYRIMCLFSKHVQFIKKIMDREW